MFQEAGCFDEDIILEFLNASTGAGRDVYQQMDAHLAGSQDLKSVFRHDDWSLNVRDRMSMFVKVVHA